MTLIELNYLVVLAQEQHFGRAAARCGVSQPALSTAVRKLETDLGVLLFERNKSGISLTRLGEQIAAQANHVIAQTQVIKTLADANKDQLSGPFRLGAIPTLSPYILPGLTFQLGLMASKLCLMVDESCSDQLCQRLTSGELDAILVSQPFGEVDWVCKDLVCKELFTEPLAVLMNNTHAHVANKRITLFDMRSQVIFLFDESHCLCRQVLAVFAHLKDEDKPVFKTMSSLETIRHMVAAGLGCAILPLSAANTSLYTANLFTTREFAEPVPTRTIFLAWRASFPRHKTIDLLRNALQICSWQFTTGHNEFGTGSLVENSNW
jgi:LysR family transcriptional regulator, hydrogen peroxide-inducible genes activator